MEDLQTIMRAVLPDKTLERAQDHVARRLDPWRQQEEAMSLLMPNVELQPMDMIFNLDVIGAVEDQKRRCGSCNPQAWTYSPKTIPLNPSERSCNVPLLPVVNRGEKEIPSGCGVGRLRLTWLPCRVFRKWVEEHARKESGEEPKTFGDGPRKTWKRRR